MISTYDATAPHLRIRIPARTQIHHLNTGALYHYQSDVERDAQLVHVRAVLRPMFHFRDTGGLGEVPLEAAVVVGAVALTVAAGVVCAVGDEPSEAITASEPLVVDARLIARRAGDAWAAWYTFTGPDGRLWSVAYDQAALRSAPSE
ncbi:hypothetical protein SE17_04395 [Kouleothrix aurantiaca]|jgi:hypothetical protein|uniref:Uncharacterized protein n=1 Tax=Kouleothrix aurantiaca TaxID=186479 RepID=A0A0N8PT25_9CHLR|nr:hypothetical protein SE17_04395 [Kouleothrix aurantiaca]